MINVGSSCTQTHQNLEHGGRGRSFSQADQKPVQKTEKKKKGPHEQDGSQEVIRAAAQVSSISWMTQK